MSKASGRPWGPLRGETAELNDLARFLRQQIIEAGLNLGQLEPHVGLKPSTISQRLSGVKINEAFVIAVITACTASPKFAGNRDNLTEIALRLWQRSTANRTRPSQLPSTQPPRNIGTLAVESERVIEAQAENLELYRQMKALHERLDLVSRSERKAWMAERDANQLTIMLSLCVWRLSAEVERLKVVRDSTIAAVPVDIARVRAVEAHLALVEVRQTRSRRDLDEANDKRERAVLLLAEAIGRRQTLTENIRQLAHVLESGAITAPTPEAASRTQDWQTEFALDDVDLILDRLEQSARELTDQIDDTAEALEAATQVRRTATASSEDWKAPPDQTDEELLRDAIADGSLILHYQPEVDLRTGRITALEALVRWPHPTKGLQPPGAFLSLAEATNLIGELGRWVIRSACAQIAEWRRRGLATDVVMRINVSPVQLVSLDFVEQLEDVLRLFDIDGSSIGLEITEHMVMQDLPRIQVTLHEFKRMGVRIVLDDFGTGYSSLAHLKALPVDAVKIDRSFVQRLGASSDDLVIVKSIIGLAGSFGLGAIGVGVETPVAARTLSGLGCYRAQGFLIARPMPAEQAETHLVEGRIPLDLDLPRVGLPPSAR